MGVWCEGWARVCREVSCVGTWSKGLGYGVSGLRLEVVDEWCEDLVWG